MKSRFQASLIAYALVSTAAAWGQDTTDRGKALVDAQCNSCHEATNFGFNRVQRPATNPYPNQVFEPVRR